VHSLCQRQLKEIAESQDGKLLSLKSVTSKTNEIRLIFGTEDTFTSNSISFPYREGTRAI
jgi:hypothetical protein